MTTLGTQLLGTMWPTLKRQGALSTGVYKQIVPGTLTSTSVITGVPSAGSTTSTGLYLLLQDFRQMEIDHTNVIRGDRKARFPTNILSVTPDTDDQVAIGSVTYRVVAVRTPVDGASYELHLRNV